MLHFVIQYTRQESYSRSLRIAFENQLYLNTSVSKLASAMAIPVQQALIIIGEKIGTAEQLRAMNFDTFKSKLLTFEQLENLIKQSFREKDMAVLEAAFNDLDHNKLGFLDAHEISRIFREYSTQLYRIRGDGFAKEADLFKIRSEAGRDKRIFLQEFQKIMMNFNLNRDFISEAASEYNQSGYRNERFATPELDMHNLLGNSLKVPKMHGHSERMSKEFDIPTYNSVRYDVPFTNSVLDKEGQVYR